MNEQQPGHQPKPPTEDHQPKSTAKSETKDYIEFEEVKEKKTQ
ncbi:MAG: hypothetical protein JWN76_1813 [Chitinophagaceae bacterium]|nr:hypothetical protein [Chitinophagaceae bacterium]